MGNMMIIAVLYGKARTLFVILMVIRQLKTLTIMFHLQFEGQNLLAVGCYHEFLAPVI